MAPIILNIVIHETKLQKMLAFDTKMMSKEACKEIRNKLQDTLLKGLGKEEDYGLFQPDKSDSSKGWWLRQNTYLKDCQLESRDSLEYRNRFRILRVKLLDNSVKALIVDDSLNVDQLMISICKSIGIENHIEYSLMRENQPKEKIEKRSTLKKAFILENFDIDKKLNDTDMELLKRELCLDDSADWVNPDMTLREQGIVESEILTIKQRIFLDKSSETIDNPIVRNMQYEQAKQDITKGKQPVTEEQAVRFATLQVQIQFGDYQEYKHKPGFLLKRLTEFMEPNYAKLGDKIEKKILDSHKDLLLKGRLTEAAGKVAYIKLAQSLPTFGTNFFVVKEQIKGKNKLANRLLGVTKYGILRLDEKTKDIIETWPLSSVNRWAATRNIFTLDAGNYSKGFYSVQTSEAERISNIVEKYIASRKKRKFVDVDTSSPVNHSTALPSSSDEDSSDEDEEPLVVNDKKTMVSKTKSEDLTPSQRALMVTITNGKKALINSMEHIDSFIELDDNLLEELLTEEGKSKNISSAKTSVISLISAMNAASAKMILTSGYGVDSDHDSIGAAVATITCNVLELVEIIQMINTILEENRETIQVLIENIKKFNEVLVDLFDAVNPKDPIDGFQKAANNIGSRSKLVIDPILDELGMKTQGENELSNKAKLVSLTVEIFVQKAKDFANSCKNDEGKQMINEACNNCSLTTNQLEASAYILEPSINDPVCQEQLHEAASNIIRSVEYCIFTCKSQCGLDLSNMDLDELAKNASKALKEITSNYQ